MSLPGPDDLMHGAKAQDIAEIVAWADQLGNRLRPVCWRRDHCGHHRSGGALVRAP
jgi:hypothetical protein